MSPIPIVPQTAAYAPLDVLSSLLFVLAFIVAALATRRRPIAGVAMMLLADPFAFYRTLGETTVTLPKVVLLGVVAGLLLRGVDVRVLLDRRVRPLSIAAGAVFVATLLTLGGAHHRGETLREILKAAEYLLTFAVMLCAFAADPNEWIVRRALGGATFLVIVLALAQEYTVAPAAIALAGGIVPRIAGPLEGPNQLAGYLEIALPVLLAIRLRAGPNLFDDLLLVAGGYAALLTFSRAGLAGLALGALTVVLCTRVATRARPFVTTATACIAILAAGSGIVLIGGYGDRVIAHLPLIGHSSDAIDVMPDANGKLESGLGTRTELWRAAWTMWREHPLAGVGAGNYELEIGEVGPAGIRTHANSLYLQSLAEGGVMLLLANVALLLTVLVTFARHARNAIVLGVLAATIAIAAHQVFDYLVFFPKVGGLWWGLLGVASASVRPFAVNDGGDRA